MRTSGVSVTPAERATAGRFTAAFSTFGVGVLAALGDACGIETGELIAAGSVVEDADPIA